MQNWKSGHKASRPNANLVGRGNVMPITVTFDIHGAPPPEYNRLQSMFERLGWENLGGTDEAGCD
jgi:hypothetical protein